MSQYLMQVVEKLKSVGAILLAEQSDCPYASKTVIELNLNCNITICVNYRDVNAITIKDLFPLLQVNKVWPTFEKVMYIASVDLFINFH